MKFEYKSISYGNKRKNRLSCLVVYKTERIGLVFAVIMDSVDDVKINWCNRQHYIKKYNGFIEEDEYSKLVDVEEIRKHGVKFYKKYYKIQD
ncbi:MAG: hypothetical protein RR359_04835 [Bacilli bacterium]